MSEKYGLIIANTEYNDPGLAKLTAPGKDAEELWRVLNSPDIGAFDDVMLVLNQDSAAVNEDRKSTRLNSSHSAKSRMPSSA